MEENPYQSPKAASETAQSVPLRLLTLIVNRLARVGLLLIIAGLICAFPVNFALMHRPYSGSSGVSHDPSVFSVLTGVASIAVGIALVIIGWIAEIFFPKPQSS